MKLLNKISRRALGAVAAMGMAATLVSSPALAMDKVTAVHAFPPFLVYTKTFLSLVEDINARGKGVVEITVRGGPEAIGMFQQPAAVRDEQSSGPEFPAGPRCG